MSKRFRKSSPMLRADQAKRLLPCLIPGAGGHVWIAYRDQVSSGDVEQVDVESAPTTSRNAVIGLGHHRPWCREKEFKVEAVAIWMESGRLMGDTTEKKAVVDEYKERQAGKRSVEDVEVDGMSEEREKEWSSGPGGVSPLSSRADFGIFALCAYHVDCAVEEGSRKAYDEVCSIAHLD